MDSTLNDCAYDQWVDSLAKFLKEQRRGANVIVLIHSGPLGLEAMYNNPDPVIAQGMYHGATLALNEQLKANMSLIIQTNKSNQPAEVSKEKDLKVN